MIGPDAKSPQLLYEDAYVTVSLEDSGRLVHLTRTAVQFPDLEAMRQCYHTVIRTYDQLGRAGRSLLVDSRAPSGRNDPAYERTMFSLLPDLDRGFMRIGVLIDTAAGKLQFRRWQGIDGIERIISSDEAELRRQLSAAGSSVKPEPRRGR